MIFALKTIRYYLFEKQFIVYIDLEVLQSSFEKADAHSRLGSADG